jgi:hypothetical protein
MELHLNTVFHNYDIGSGGSHNALIVAVVATEIEKWWFCTEASLGSTLFMVLHCRRLC